MEYRREEIMPGVFLSAVRTDRFKTSALCAALLSQLDHEHAYMDSLLPSVLRRGTARCPDMASITRRLEELYGAGAIPLSMRVGEVRVTGFYSVFPDGRFIPGGASELDDIARLIGELLTAPNTRGGLLLPDYVNSEKSKLAEKIRAAKNDRGGYAARRLIELMCCNEALSASVLTDCDAAENIHYKKLTRRYRELLSNSPMEICYCGAESFERVRGAMLSAFEAMPRGEIDYDIGTDVRMNALEAEPRVFKETMDVGQGKLCMGWRLGECMEEPDSAALRVFNAVYGGTASGKLFRSLREERSLCYYVSSGVDDVKGLMYVSSGIDKADYDTVVEGITGELRKIADGEVTTDELDTARRYCAQALRLVPDDPVELTMYCMRSNITGEDATPDDLAAVCEYVTADEVIDIARSCELDTIYFLSGEDDEEAEEE